MLFLAVAATHAAPVYAADLDTERARALFDEAGELERHGQWNAAQERLRAALRLRDTPQLHYALGWALENEDKLLEARVEYETAVRLGRERRGADEVVELSTSRLADLEKKMPIIKVRLVGKSRRDARVVVDGREVKQEDGLASTPANPGSHVIRVEAGVSEAIEQMVYVGRSTVRTVDVDAGELVAPRDTAQNGHAVAAPRQSAAATSAAPASRDDQGGGALPWLLVGGGVAGVIGGAALLFLADRDASARDSMQARWCATTGCSGNAATRPESAEAAGYRRAAADATDAGNLKQILGFGIGGAGLVAAAIGTVLLVRQQPVKERRSVRASATPLAAGGYATATFSF